MQRVLFFSFIASGFIVFFIDSLIPLGYAPWLFYIILMFVFVTYGEKHSIYILTVFYSLLVIIGFFMSPRILPTLNMPILNRVGVIVILSLTAWLGIREKDAKKLTLEILERIKDVFIAIDDKFKIIFMNKRALEIAAVNEPSGEKDYFEIFGHKENNIKTYFEKALTEQSPVHIEEKLSVRDNILDVSIYPSEKGLSIFGKDITDVVKSERKLKKILRERETLLAEVHHRTKNNLQLIVSLLNLQLNNTVTEEMKKMINETRSRIMSLAILYDQLYLSGNTYMVDISTFIKDIVMKLEKASNFGLIKIQHDLQIENCRISLEDAIPLGLIINELYTNSLKYAFNGNQTGAIKISIKSDGEDLINVTYKDNGKGLPADFNLNNSKGLGASIINSFVDQMDGSIKYRNADGAEFNMVLKIKKHSETNEFE